jgi:hypothetical protein
VNFNINSGRTKSVQPGKRGAAMNDMENIVTNNGKPKISFNEAIKRGITSYSPFKRPPSQLDEDKED